MNIITFSTYISVQLTLSKYQTSYSNKNILKTISIIVIGYSCYDEEHSENSRLEVEV